MYRPKYDLRSTQPIRCIADGEVLWQRWKKRLANGERHPGHVDHTSPDARIRSLLLQGCNAPQLEVGGIRRVIDTSNFSTVPFDELVDTIQENL